MSVYHRVASKNRTGQDYHARESEITTVYPRQLNPKVHLENEKKMRREIANSNERRRMQSINAGFQHLRQLIPHSVGEKLSKAAILMQTTDYIKELQREKCRVSGQNAHLKRLLTELSRRCNVELDIDLSYGSPPTKRKKRDTESSDEGITADYDDYSADEIRREMVDLRQQLEKERQLRIILEKRSQAVEGQRLSEKIQHQIENQINVENQLKQKQNERLYAAEPKTTKPTEESRCPPLLRVPAGPVEAVCTSAPDTKESKEAICSSMSRRNLETIFEAIRHLEGNNSMSASDHTHSDSLTSIKRPITNVHSEESEKDSCITTSDQDDVRSDSSGRDSPSTVAFVKLENMKPYSVRVPSPSHTPSYIEKYPVVSNVLSGSAAQYYYRPGAGVIVQKS